MSRNGVGGKACGRERKTSERGTVKGGKCERRRDWCQVCGTRRYLEVADSPDDR